MEIPADPHENQPREPDPGRSGGQSGRQASFEAAWREVVTKIYCFCYRAMGDKHSAEEVTQTVAIRTFRSYHRIPSNVKLEPWAMRIAGREVKRELAKRWKRLRLELPLETLNDQPESGLGAPEISHHDAPWDGRVADALQAALDAKILSENEASVLRLRAQNEATWPEIGKIIGLLPENCATLWHRGNEKFRMFLFTDYVDLLGGEKAVLHAFEAARDAEISPLNSDEAPAFAEIVIKQNRRYRRAGWLNSLRSACAKVARYLKPKI